MAGDRQMKLLQTGRETDLLYRRGTSYLLATCEVEDPEPFVAEGVIGVDLGVKNIAVDSEGNVRSAKTVNSVRHRYRRLRRTFSASARTPPDAASKSSRAKNGGSLATPTT